MNRSVIPWTHRKQIGRWRAFWRTVWMAGRHPSQLARDAARPVNYRDAQKFRWLVVVVGTIPLAAAALVLRASLGDAAGNVSSDIVYSAVRGLPATRLPIWADPAICIATGWLIWPAPTLLLLLLLAGMSGAGSYFFHPPSLSVVRQNRAIALSYYAAAPLALMFVPLIFGAAAAGMQYNGLAERDAGFTTFAVVAIVAEACIPAILFCCWFSTLQILKQSTHCSGTRLFSAAVGVPLIWLVLTVLIVGVLAGILGLVKLMIASCFS